MLTNLLIIAGILIISLIGFNMTKHSFTVLEGMVEDKKKKDSSGGDDIVDIVTIAKNQAEEADEDCSAGSFVLAVAELRDRNHHHPLQARQKC